MACNHDDQPPELTLVEGLIEDLAWVAGAGTVALAFWLFLGDDNSYLLVLPVLAAIFFAVKTTWQRLTHTPRYRGRTGWKTIILSVAAGVVISVVLGFVWDSFRVPSSGSDSDDPPEWLVTTVRNSPLAPPCSSTEELNYVESQMETLLQQGPLVERMTRLLSDPPSSKLDMDDEEWQLQISVLLVDMEELGEELRKYRPVPDSLEQTHRAMTDIGDSITSQANTYRSILQAIYDGNRFEALVHMEKVGRLADDFEESSHDMLERLAEECELDIETP